jgi:hypothetical protein
MLRKMLPCHENVLGSGGVLPTFVTAALGKREWCAARHRAGLDTDGAFPRLTSASFLLDRTDWPICRPGVNATNTCIYMVYQEDSGLLRESIP